MPYTLSRTRRYLRCWPWSREKGTYHLKQENPKLWYGIGILYDRYGSLDNAEEAFSSVLKMDKGTHAYAQFQSMFCLGN